MKRFLFLVCLIGIGFISPIYAAPAQTGAAFVREACSDVVVGGNLPGTLDESTECGWLTVPLQHGNPDGETIELGVVILRAKDAANRARDPLFMAQGGPGGSTIESYLSTMADSPIRTQRDIVLFDQRGTKHTRPQLQCGEFDDLLLRTVELDVPDAEAEKQNLEATQACRTRLQKEGVNLSAFDSVENAADVNALREALGYDQINFYGVSYGTLLGQHVMRNSPQILRSIILDGVVAPRQSFVAEAGRSENNALTQLFGACKAAAKCNTAYPNLEKALYEASARLNQTPARVPMSDLETSKSYNVVVDGDSLQSVVFQSLYATDLLPYLPYMIDEASKGNYAPLGNVASLFVFDRSVSYGMYFSMTCAEDGNFDPNAVDSSGLRPQIAERNIRDLKSLQETCALWNVELLPASADAPVESDVPTLLLSGRFDPITPAKNAEDVARTLSNATTFVFPNTGHGAFQSEKCASRIAQAFLDDPKAKPDGSCIGALKPPQFRTRADIMPVPALANFLSINERVRLPLALAGIGLLLLLGAWLVIPLSWVLRLVMKRTGGTLPTMAKAMPWLTLLNGFVLAVFFGALAAAVVGLIQNNDYLFLFGLPVHDRWIFVLPIVGVGLTTFVLIGTVAGLRSNGWGVLRKINRAVLALACVVCLVGLGMMGLLVVPLLT